MPKRATRRPSALFQRVLTQAHKKLALDAEEAANFEHKGLRGNERAAALAEFLTGHLPSIFKTGKGEARDFQDRVTGELDLFIYDHSTAAPIQSGAEGLIVPAEALYGVIEVKSVLTGDELEKCFAAAQKVRSLRPFKEEFIANPGPGAVARDRCRCPYIVFTYTSNLGEDDWVNKEYRRISEKAKAAGGNVNLLDSVVVLDRGIIRPQDTVSLLKDDSSSLFLEFYVHLINFLTRERKRRPVIDWTAYTSGNKWTKLKP
jgi:hypothetical protein